MKLTKLKELKLRKVIQKMIKESIYGIAPRRRKGQFNGIIQYKNEELDASIKYDYIEHPPPGGQYDKYNASNWTYDLEIAMLEHVEIIFKLDNRRFVCKGSGEISKFFGDEAEKVANDIISQIYEDIAERYEDDIESHIRSDDEFDDSDDYIMHESSIQKIKESKELKLRKVIRKMIKESINQYDAGLPNSTQRLEYYINLNERGPFSADVCNSANGKTIFTIKAGDELKAGESSIFEDEYMKNMHDMKGLLEYLKEMGLASANATLVDMQPRER